MSCRQNYFARSMKQVLGHIRGREWILRKRLVFIVLAWNELVNGPTDTCSFTSRGRLMHTWCQSVFGDGEEGY